MKLRTCPSKLSFRLRLRVKAIENSSWGPTAFAISQRHFLAFYLASSELRLRHLQSLPTIFWNSLKKVSSGNLKRTFVVATEISNLALEASSFSAVRLSLMSIVLREGKTCFLRKFESPFYKPDRSTSASSASINFLSKLMKFLWIASSDSNSSKRS